ncbi:MAG: hypothetical protein R2827_05540 [Bdellovibrionales bacterium]
MGTVVSNLNALKGKARSATPSLQKNQKEILFVRFAQFICAFGFLWNGVVSMGVIFQMPGTRAIIANPVVDMISRVAAQEIIDVFNLSDLTAGGGPNIILAEINENDEPIRVVPFTDVNGGRLAFHSNPHLYFSNSLQFLRLPYEFKFIGDQLSPYSKELITKILRLDNCLVSPDKPLRYLLVIGQRELMQNNNNEYVWSPTRPMLHRWVDGQPSDISHPKCGSTFLVRNYRHNHDERAEMTLAQMKIWAEEFKNTRTSQPSE